MSGRTRSNVRWNEALDEWEMRCEDCAKKGNVASYWPLSPDFWDRKSMQRCRACNRELLNRRKAAYRADPTNREAEAERTRRWRQRNPDYSAEYAATRRRLHPDLVARENRAYYEANRERLLPRNRAYKARIRGKAA